jgi:DNA repair protein RadC
MAHNHPSGSSDVSRDDVSMTQDVRRALQPLSIGLYDHLIVTRDSCVSMRRQGLLNER